MTLRRSRPGLPGGVSGPRRRLLPVVSARGVAVLLAGVVALGGCSGDEPAGPADRAPFSTAVTDARTTVSLGRVTGDLARARRAAARDAVAALVDRWFAAAYLGDEPPEGAGRAFPGFTPGVARQARADRALTTNAALAPRVDDVVGRRGDVVVDLLATGGRAQAATARFVLVMDLTGEVDRVDRVERVSGRLYLTPGGPGWQVVGYDVERGRQR